MNTAPPRQYRFIGRMYQIPYGAIVNLLYWGKHRHVLIEYNGVRYRSMGTLLRKIKEVSQ